MSTLAMSHLSAAMRSMERYSLSLSRADVKKAVNHGVRAAIIWAGNKHADPEMLFSLFELFAPAPDNLISQTQDNTTPTA